MRLLTFRGGVHPPDNKHWTADKQIEDLLPKGDLVFPMSQHIGAPCMPAVKKGDYVHVHNLASMRGRRASGGFFCSSDFKRIGNSERRNVYAHTVGHRHNVCSGRERL